LPARFTAALDLKKKFSHTPYDLPTLIQTCTKLTRRAVERSGGRIEKDDEGKEVFVVPVSEIKPSTLMKSWDPIPLSGGRFTKDELRRLQQ
jgi:hypothetical protein